MTSYKLKKYIENTYMMFTKSLLVYVTLVCEWDAPVVCEWDGRG